MNRTLANLFEGSPIIIGGGGSVNIHFNEDDYIPTGEPGVFLKENDELIAAYVVDLDGVPVGSDLTRYVEDKNCVITIHTVNDDEELSDIIISSRPGDSIRLEFDPYEFRLNEGDPKKRPHYSPDRRLVEPIEIQVIDGDDEPITSPVPADGRCIITLVNSKPFGA